MSSHFSAEVLARYQAGDLGARKAARVAAHLLGCEQCGATLSGLTAVSGMLAAIERPAMPVAVADRLQILIARESASRAAALAPAADGISSATATDAPAADQAGTASGTAPRAHVPGRPDLPERRSRRQRTRRHFSWPRLSSPLVLRGAAAAAAVALLAGGGFLLARGTNVQGPGSNAGAARPSVRGAGAGNHRSALGSNTLSGRAQVHYRSHGKVMPAVALASHKNYTKAGLADQVRKEVSSRPNLVPAPQYGTAKKAGRTTIGGVSIGMLGGCLTLVAAGRQVVLAEVARYIGKPATIIVLKSSKARVLDVAVVGVACSAKAADYIVRTTIPAP